VRQGAAARRPPREILICVLALLDSGSRRVVQNGHERHSSAATR